LVVWLQIYLALAEQVNENAYRPVGGRDNQLLNIGRD
jgi:hypothetical protein